MSLQVFLQAQLLGANEFLATLPSGSIESVKDFSGRCAWLNLLCEVLPRALLAELKLSRMLLGSSSAEQFLLVLAEEDVPRANDLLTRVSVDVSRLSSNTIRLIWASTENLGAWPVVRKRLDDVLSLGTSAPLANTGDVSIFEPAAEASEPEEQSFFSEFAEKLASAARVGWSNEKPGHLMWDGGHYSWALTDQSGLDDEAILFSRRVATDDAGHPASLAELAARSSGASRWGILIGDIDHFDAQLRRAGSIEDHLHLSVLFKEFFAGELSLLCTLPEFWRKVSILYRGGDDFIVIGSWDTLVLLARELERLFEKFAEHNLQSLPSLEGKKVSMALAIAPEIASSPSSVFEVAALQLRHAKATAPGSFDVFGRTLEWKRLNDAEELKSSLVRLVRDFGYSPNYIHDLASVYREALPARMSRKKSIRADKPWRTYMRLAQVIPQSRGKEVNNLRNAVIASLIGKRTTSAKLRPSGRVGLEWARLAAGDPA